MSQKNERVVDLCIWVDANAYDPNVDKEKLFDSLYQIVCSIAIKNKLLPNWTDYQPFSLYAASRLYLRLTNTKQFDVSAPKKMKKIKSILNFIKKTMHPMIVDFQNQDFQQNFTPQLHGETVEDIRHRVIQKARSQYSDLNRVDFEYYLGKICYTIKGFLKELPYCNDELMNHRLYVSCLMTLLNQITLSNVNKNRYKKRLQKGFKTEEFLERAYQEEVEYSVVLYHLDDSMYNYVSTIVNRLKSLIVKDLRDLIGSNEPSDAVIQSIISGQAEASYVEE